MAGVRGTRSFYPPKRGTSKKMFTGTSTSNPHAGLQKEALKPSNNVGGMKNTVGGDAKRQAQSYRGGHKNGG